MLTGFARAALLAEVLAYACIGAWLASRRGWTVPEIAGVAIAVSIGLRLAFVAGSMALAAIASHPRRPEERLGLARGARLLMQELVALLATTYALIPFPRLAAPRDDAAEPSGGIPVVLVHGYFGNRGYLAPLMRRLRADRIGPLFAPSLPSTFASIEQFTEALGRQVERIAEATRQPRVILVCHSMGGLAARRYLANGGSGRVARLITIASPHGGTALGRFGLGTNARQMQPGSAFLRALERDESSPGDRPPATSLYSLHDNLVAPAATSRLAWARNAAFPGHGHLAMLWVPKVYEALREELREAGAGGA